MKTVTRDLYINIEALGCWRRGQFEYVSASLSEEPLDPIRTEKITVTFTMPEKKITLSESEFNEVIKKFFMPTLKDFSPMDSGIKMQDHLRNVLFGDKNE